MQLFLIGSLVLFSTIFLLSSQKITHTVLGITSVHAKADLVKVKDPAGYAATFVSQNIPDPIEIEAGSSKDVIVTFKNSGTRTWDNTGSRFISAYTMEPRYRASAFSGGDWLSNKQTSKMSGVVKPGQNGSIKITLHAPKKTGNYVERFYLASENSSWISNGYFFFKIKVVEPSFAKAAEDKKVEEVQKIEEVKKVEPVVKTSVSKGKKLAQSVKSASVVGGDKIKVITVFQNTGDVNWKGYSLRSDRPTKLDGSSKQTYANKSWNSHTEVFDAKDEIVKHGVIRKEFYINAPKTVGEYDVNLAFYSDNKKIEGTDFVVTLNVTQHAPFNYDAPSFGESTKVNTPSTVADAAPDNIFLDKEPRIRVGMHLPMDFVQFKAKDDYRLMANGKEIGIVPAGRLVVVVYDGIYYKVKAHDLEYIDIYAPRLEPVNDEHAIFELINFDRYVKWKGPNNFNTYRGAFEYSKGKIDQKMYAVNDLYLSDYVAGIAETSNRAPKEYIRALLTAARTYAFMSKEKYPFFDVLGNTYDQLYLGYESERLMPYVAQAARDTRGYLITHNGKVVVTPYFANSTGRTVTWQSAWGGSNKAWLQPVSANYDVGQRMRGHGVGMSARDAAIRADKEGVDWKYLIKYYYTGVDVLRVYK